MELGNSYLFGKDSALVNSRSFGVTSCEISRYVFLEYTQDETELTDAWVLSEDLILISADLSFWDSRHLQFLVTFSRKIKCFPLETAAIYIKDTFSFFFSFFLLLYTWNKL